MNRPDGREPDQLRQVAITPGWLKYADGSALIEMGDTRVLCSAIIEDRVPVWRKGSGRGWITAEYEMIPAATESRTPREGRRGKVSGRSQEIQRFIGRSLRAVTDLAGLGERTAWLDCDVLQADAGTRTAAVTGACVALTLALRRCVEANRIGKVCMKGLVAAASVVKKEGLLLLDPCYQEDAAAEVDLNVVRTGSGKFVEIQGTAEADPFSREELDRMVDLAGSGIDRLIAVQREILGEAAAEIPGP
jgi:ribonuclease PH